MVFSAKHTFCGTRELRCQWFLASSIGLGLTLATLAHAESDTSNPPNLRDVCFNQRDSVAIDACLSVLRQAPADATVANRLDDLRPQKPAGMIPVELRTPMRPLKKRRSIGWPSDRELVRMTAQTPRIKVRAANKATVDASAAIADG